MRSLVRWAIYNTPAMNTLMGCLLLVGAMSAYMLKREVFPQFELEIILVTVPYPGASPDEVENGICQKIEEAVRSVDGIKKVTSVAAEGSGSVVIELQSDISDVQKVLNEVEGEIDQIPSFPVLAEEPEIKQLSLSDPAIKVGVVGPDINTVEAELALREIAEKVRDDLLLIPQISLVDIQGARDYQIDVEISEATLRKYDLTLQKVANQVRAQNLELPGGKLKSDSQEYLLRGKDKRMVGEEIAKIPLVTDPSGVVLTVGDLGTVYDAFADTTSISRINGRPGMAISVEAAAREDILEMTHAVREYVRQTPLPAGYQFQVWDDRSIDVQDRLDLLIKNGSQGLILVFLVLAIFMQLRLSFWIALGIPISVMGACIVLFQTGSTLNMLSLFAFLIALGIVVDDAIVIGENIFTHRELGKDSVTAAIDGTVEVLPSVIASVTTTILAFMPMFYVTGVMGKFFAILPLAVISMLVVSLIEATFILPCHLAHGNGSGSRFLAVLGFLAFPFRLISRTSRRVNSVVASLLESFIANFYTPLINRCLNYPAITVSLAFAVFVVSLGLVTNGMVPWVVFPKLDARQIVSTVVFPDGTPSHVTEQATAKIERAILAVNDRHRDMHDGRDIVALRYNLVGQVTGNSPSGRASLTTGGHAGMVQVELIDNTLRKVTSQVISEEWRKEAGTIPGVESVTYGTLAMGPGGSPIEFKLLASAENMSKLEEAVEACKDKLAKYPGVFDISDDSRPGKWEMQLAVKENAKSLGVPLQAIANTVRAAYYGDEVMRLQRGRHEVKLMVRYPDEDRRSIADFENIRVDVGDGLKRPIQELAHVKFERGYSEINRVDQKRSITITADVDEAKANASQIVADLKATFMPTLGAEYPDVSVRWEGQQEQTVESVQSLFVGFTIAMFAMYALLTLMFTSYFQPAIIMAVIPFGAIGALWGHAFMGLPLTLFSVLGLVALAGVVVNDSIVLIDSVNQRIKAGMPYREALVDAGQRRFRPVLLTSLTTIAGLLPILTERSFQAQLLIPMATSLSFGLMLATALVLVLVPTFYLIYFKVLAGGQVQTEPVDAKRQSEPTVEIDAESVDRRTVASP